jgi:two-component system phosphate regulon response regulator PhoB
MHRPIVLIVEDEDDLRRMYRQALALEGFEVREARSGYEALRCLDTVRPDIIVLDLGLPGVDGLTVRDELAGSAHTRTIPIVVVTGSPELYPTLNVECVMRKPVQPDELVRTVQKCLVSGGA